MATLGDLTTDLTGGVAMPLVGLGTWRLRGAAGREAVGWALEAGYRLVDTATAYGNEAEVGRAIVESGLPREEVFVTTKLPAERADDPRGTLRRSLDALQLDAVDLWLLHWPPDGEARPDVWAELLRARDDGLARAVGVSNYDLAQVDELVRETGEAPAANQVPWAPALFDAAFLGGSRERGVVVEGYSPFRAGDLDARALTTIAERYGATPAQVVVRWHVQHGIPVIPKSARRERITSNADVLGFALDSDDMASIDELGRPS